MSREREQDNFWRGRRVFITGCTGFLGSWLTAALLERGAAVVGLIRMREPDSQLVRTGLIGRVDQVQGHLLDYDLLHRTLVDKQIDTVFHLAGQTIVGIANRDPSTTFETNIRGTWLLLEAVRQTPTVRGVVVASSEKAYGEQTTLPYLEDYPLQGRHPYEVSKSCADLIALIPDRFLPETIEFIEIDTERRQRGFIVGYAAAVGADQVRESFVTPGIADEIDEAEALRVSQCRLVAVVRERRVQRPDREQRPTI